MKEQQELQLLEKIAAASNQTTSVEAVLEFAVIQVCQFANWDVGHSYLTIEGADTRACGRRGRGTPPTLPVSKNSGASPKRMEFWSWDRTAGAARSLPKAAVDQRYHG